jgi:hypothetical protein
LRRFDADEGEAIAMAADGDGVRVALRGPETIVTVIRVDASAKLVASHSWSVAGFVSFDERRVDLARALPP